MIQTTSTKVQPQQSARSDFFIPTPFFLQVIFERWKELSVRIAISFTENLICSSTKSLSFEKHCIDIQSFPPIREHHYSYFYHIHYRTCQSRFADVPLTVVFNSVENITTEIFSKAKNAKDFSSPIQDVLLHFLKKLQEANELLEQPIVVSSVIVELCNTQQFFVISDVVKVKTLKFPRDWLLRDLAHLKAFQYKGLLSNNCFEHCSKVTN